jgi:hypothetical protein
MKKIILVLLVGLGMLGTSFTPAASEYELQIAKGTADAVQKVMKKFSVAHPDIEVAMNHTGDVYVLRVGGCNEMAKVTELKNTLVKEYPAATIEPCN